jgi:hypothetical protein
MKETKEMKETKNGSVLVLFYVVCIICTDQFVLLRDQSKNDGQRQENSNQTMSTAATGSSGSSGAGAMAVVELNKMIRNCRWDGKTFMSLVNSAQATYVDALTATETDVIGFTIESKSDIGKVKKITDDATLTDYLRSSNFYYMTPLLMTVVKAECGCILNDLIHDKQFDVAARLINAGRSITTVYKPSGSTAIHFALEEGSFSLVKLMIEKHGPEILLQKSKTRNILHWSDQGKLYKNVEFIDWISKIIKRDYNLLKPLWSSSHSWYQTITGHYIADKLSLRGDGYAIEIGTPVVSFQRPNPYVVGDQMFVDLFPAKVINISPLRDEILVHYLEFEDYYDEWVRCADKTRFKPDVKVGDYITTEQENMTGVATAIRRSLGCTHVLVSYDNGSKKPAEWISFTEPGAVNCALAGKVVGRYVVGQHVVGQYDTATYVVEIGTTTNLVPAHLVYPFPPLNPETGLPAGQKFHDSPARPPDTKLVIDTDYTHAKAKEKTNNTDEKTLRCNTSPNNTNAPTITPDQKTDEKTMVPLQTTNGKSTNGKSTDGNQTGENVKESTADGTTNKITSTTVKNPGENTIVEQHTKTDNVRTDKNTSGESGTYVWVEIDGKIKDSKRHFARWDGKTLMSLLNSTRDYHVKALTLMQADVVGFTFELCNDVKKITDDATLAACLLAYSTSPDNDIGGMMRHNLPAPLLMTTVPVKYGSVLNDLIAGRKFKEAAALIEAGTSITTAYKRNESKSIHFALEAASFPLVKLMVDKHGPEVLLQKSSLYNVLQWADSGKFYQNKEFIDWLSRIIKREYNLLKPLWSSDTWYRTMTGRHVNDHLSLCGNCYAIEPGTTVVSYQRQVQDYAVGDGLFVGAFPAQVRQVSREKDGLYVHYLECAKYYDEWIKCPSPAPAKATDIKVADQTDSKGATAEWVSATERIVRNILTGKVVAYCKNAYMVQIGETNHLIPAQNVYPFPPFDTFSGQAAGHKCQDLSFHCGKCSIKNNKPTINEPIPPPPPPPLPKSDINILTNVNWTPWSPLVMVLVVIVFCLLTTAGNVNNNISAKRAVAMCRLAAEQCGSSFVERGMVAHIWREKREKEMVAGNDWYKGRWYEYKQLTSDQCLHAAAWLHRQCNNDRRDVIAVMWNDTLLGMVPTVEQRDLRWTVRLHLAGMEHSMASIFGAAMHSTNATGNETAEEFINRFALPVYVATHLVNQLKLAPVSVPELDSDPELFNIVVDQHLTDLKRSFVTFDNWNIGHHNSVIQLLTTINIDRCANLCLSTPNCNAITHRSVNGWCWLKTVNEKDNSQWTLANNITSAFVHAM